MQKGLVRFGYQHFAFLGAESEYAAEASECAAEQDAFWAFHDLLYFDKYGGENQGAFSRENLKQFAAELGLDTAAFDACLESGKYTSIVREGKKLGQSMGVRGTPAFLVNGQPVVGAQPFEVFQQVIEKEISTAGSASPASALNSSSVVPTPAPGVTSIEPGEAVPIQGTEHVKQGEAHPEYNSDPPTSGWHLAQALPAGFYEEPQLDEALVHNLEHGHVVIAYDCGKLADPSTGSGQRCEAIKAKLKDLVNRYDGWKVTVVPRQNEDTAIGLTAWGRIDELDDYDEARITAFIDAYRDQGPEKTLE